MARVLLVDDFDLTRRLARDVLERGHEVCAVGAAEEARQRLREEPFDLLVTELCVGTEIAHARRCQPAIRCLVVTAWVPEACRCWLAVNGVSWLLKPYRACDNWRKRCGPSCVRGKAGRGEETPLREEGDSSRQKASRMKRLAALSEFRLNERGILRVLGPLEADVMEVLWREEPLTVREVHERLVGHEELAYTTVMTIMHRLHQKGLLRRRRQGAGHRYRPTMDREAFQREVVDRVLSGLLDDFPELARQQVWRMVARRAV